MVSSVVVCLKHTLYTKRCTDVLRIQINGLIFTAPFFFFCIHAVRCVQESHDIVNGAITYTPPADVSFDVLPVGQRFIGTIATYSCSPGYQLVGGSSLRACGPGGTWNGTEPSCGN